MSKLTCDVSKVQYFYHDQQLQKFHPLQNSNNNSKTIIIMISCEFVIYVRKFEYYFILPG